MIFVFEYYIFFLFIVQIIILFQACPTTNNNSATHTKCRENGYESFSRAGAFWSGENELLTHEMERKTRLKSWKLRTTTRGESIDTLSKLKYVCSRNYFQLKQIGLSRVNNRLRINEAVCYLFTVHVDRLCLRARALVSLPLRSVTIMSYQ